MDEERQQDYLNLIDALLMRLSGEIAVIFLSDLFFGLSHNTAIG